MVAQMPRSGFQRSFFGLALLASALIGCSSAGDDPADSAPKSDDPPGAALPLSIGGALATDGEGQYDSAINCAVALNITAERLMQMSSTPNSNEIKLIARAEEHFKARAEQAKATAGPEISGTPTAAMARRRSEKAGEASEQAQLAIACLRRFGDETGG